MSTSKSIRVYDYVNHPYDEVRKALAGDTVAVFQNATKVAAKRAETVASELHVKLAGIEVGTEIDISVNSVEDLPKEPMKSPMTRIELQWEAAKLPRLFPFMKAELTVYPLTATETQLNLEGKYEPPLGLIGGALDAVAGHRIAEASVHQFIKDVAAYLREEIS
ncbi:MAG: hypothetical protein OEM82_03045 [Acidobacteriota bacterium]|nr:hypothetical protein [Acidobacteriota bacterium]MDH3530500.1 hypothetical protein [Acidobacteriota bacterium]